MTSARPSAGQGSVLRSKIGLLARLLRPKEDASTVKADRVLPTLLFGTYWVASASVPLLRAALARAEELGKRDRVASGLRAYFAGQIAEEHSHAEWVLEDLELLGVPRSQTLAGAPPTAIVRLVGSQYYLVNHQHPAALLAYIAVLEEYVTPARELHLLVERSALPKGAFRTLSEHAGLDREHVKEVYRLLDALPLEPVHAQLLSRNAFNTIELLNQAHDELFQASSQSRRRNTAPRRRRPKAAASR